MKQIKQNIRWFERRGAFSYLNIDQDNIIRIRKVENYLSNYIKKSTAPIKLLDIGCGDGFIGKKFQDLGYAVYGIDVSTKNIKLAKKKDIKATTADALEKLPYKDNYFDIVFAGEIIEHLFDTRAFLNNIYRVLKPSGQLIVTTPNLVHLPDRLKFLCGKSPLQVSPLHEHLNLHIRPFTHNTLVSALKECRFEVRKFESTLVVFARDPQDPEQITSSSKLLAELFPKLGSFLIVYAFKM